MTPARVEPLKVARTTLVEKTGGDGSAFGAAFADLVDAEFRRAWDAAALPGEIALVALGSFARRELCPGSDIDVMLLHEQRSPPDAGALWYPLWDAGLVLGHSVRTRKEALRLAESDLDALTSFLETRFLLGDAELAAGLAERAVKLAHRRRERLIEQLADAAAARRDRPGPIAELLEPNLKQGWGGLRDIQALEWAGVAIDGAGTRSGLEGLVALGYLQPEDPPRLAAAKARLLTTRVALHRVTATRTDVVALQDQDAVARIVGEPDADDLMRNVSAAARDVEWIASDAWSRLRGSGPSGRVARRDHALADGVVLREGRVTLTATADPVDAALTLRVAAAAAQTDMPIERTTLAQLGEIDTVHWDPETRDAFFAVLSAGRPAVNVLEALDHVGAWSKFVPEWERVRAQPQRNAYHQYTVDRHLLEAVAQAAALRNEDGLDGNVARRAPGDALVLGALFHDIGKAGPGDHSVEGAKIARAFAANLGMNTADIELIEWLVANHLLLAETATRRDLAEEATIVRFGRAVGTSRRLDLLYALTIADSRATGPAAWNPAKAALCRELFHKADSLLEQGVISSTVVTAHRNALRARLGPEGADEFLDAMPTAYTTAFDADVQVRHRALLAAGDLAVEWTDATGDQLQVTVVAPDRTGLLATVAGALALAGFDIHDAAGYSNPGGMALEVFTGVDRFGRLAQEDERGPFVPLLESALNGELALAEELAARRELYRAPPTAGGVGVSMDLDASDFATVIEVHAPDEMGLLARVASAFADAHLDVYLTKVATLGERVVDVFYVRDADGQKVVDRDQLETLKAEIIYRLASR